MQKFFSRRQQLHSRPRISLLIWLNGIVVTTLLVLTLLPPTRHFIITHIAQYIRRPSSMEESIPTQIQQLSIELAELKQSCQSIMDEKALEKFSQQNSYTVIPSIIIGTNVSAVSPFSILNKGSRDGIIAGMPVIVGDGIVIGTIYTVRSQESTLLPITHPSTRIASSVLNEQRTIGIIQGSANVSLQLTLIPRSELISPNQVVVTSGIQLLIPRGLILGVITEVHSDSSDIFQTADIRLLADPQRYSTVGIVQKMPL